MSRTQIHVAIFPFLTLSLFGPVIPSLAAQDPQITEWEVPWEESRPRDPYVGPDGKVWFVGQRSHYLAYLDPVSSEFKRYELEEGTGPHNVIVDEGGTPWYAGNLARHIGRLDPMTGDIEKVMMPDERAGDPHTLVFDGKGGIWFTIQAGNFVGHLTKDTGKVKLVEMPQTETRTGLTSSRPYGIKMDAEGQPWIVLFNTNKIASVDPETLAVKTYELPEGARPRRLEVTPDQSVWYVDFARGQLGRLDPASGEVQEFPTPGGNLSRPYGMALDHRDRIWFVEGGTQPARFVGFDPASEEFFSITELESGGGSVRHMVFHDETLTIWFGTDTNTIGRAIVPR
jgi:virginiamycin B lyase